MKRDFDSYLQPAASGCIEWTGRTVKSNGRESHRYGRTRVNGKEVLAHRLAFERKRGVIPPGLMVLHRCDNTRCCNVDHLFLGTHLDNMADMRAKGRAHRDGNPHAPRGERAPAAKLTDAAVLSIRAARAAGATTVELARQYGVNTSVISRAARGLTWSHL